LTASHYVYIVEHMGETASGRKIAKFTRREACTAIRILACIALLAAFLWGSSLLVLGGQAVIAMVTVFSILAAYELTIREVSQGWVLACVLFIQGSLGGGYLVWLHFQPPAPTGPLIAANDPSPPLGCKEVPGPHDLLMAFGSDRVIGKGPGPFSPLMVDDCVVLSLGRKGNGLMLRAFGYDFNNDIAFRVMDNVYEPSMPLQLRALRPDRSTFVLLDRFDKEVLYVRYLNPHAVRIRGRFLCGERPQAIVHDDTILMGGVRINGVFVGQRPTTGHVCAHVAAGAYGIALLGHK
jgi:hypothetical protein